MIYAKIRYFWNDGKFPGQQSIQWEMDLSNTNTIYHPLCPVFTDFWGITAQMGATFNHMEKYYRYGFLYTLLIGSSGRKSERWKKNIAMDVSFPVIFYLSRIAS